MSGIDIGTMRAILDEANKILESKGLPQIEKIRLNGASAEGWPQVNAVLKIKGFAQIYVLDFLPGPIRDISLSLPNPDQAWVERHILNSLELFCSLLRRKGYLGEIADWQEAPQGFEEQAERSQEWLLSRKTWQKPIRIAS